MLAVFSVAMRGLAVVDALDPRGWIPVRARDHALNLAFALSAVPVVAVAVEFARLGGDVREWDLMFIGGYSAVVLGLWFVRGQKDRMERMVSRLHDRGVLQLDASDRKLLFKRSESVAQLWSHRVGLALALLMLIIFALALTGQATHLGAFGAVSETVAGTVAGYVVGRQIGRLAWYSFFWRFTERGEVRPQGGHPDGVAGLKPVGDYYFTHAMLLAIPVGHLLLWSLLIPFWDVDYYDNWRTSYQLLLTIAIALEILAFVLPMWRFHVRMVEARRLAVATADKHLTPQIDVLNKDLASELDLNTRRKKQDDLDAIVRAYREAEHMPTWPVSRPMARRFAINNALFALPLVGQVADGNGSWESLAERIVGS